MEMMTLTECRQMQLNVPSDPELLTPYEVVKFIKALDACTCINRQGEIRYQATEVVRACAKAGLNPEQSRELTHLLGE